MVWIIWLKIQEFTAIFSIFFFKEGRWGYLRVFMRKKTSAIERFMNHETDVQRTTNNADCALWIIHRAHFRRIIHHSTQIDMLRFLSIRCFFLRIELFRWWLTTMLYLVPVRDISDKRTFSWYFVNWLNVVERLMASDGGIHQTFTVWFMEF